MSHVPSFSINLIYVSWENMTDDDTSMVLDAIQATRRAYWQMGFHIFAVCSTRRSPDCPPSRLGEAAGRRRASHRLTDRPRCHAPRTDYLCREDNNNLSINRDSYSA